MTGLARLTRTDETRQEDTGQAGRQTATAGREGRKEPAVVNVKHVFFVDRRSRGVGVDMEMSE